MSKIEINNVFKIFGPKPSSVLQMVKDGSSKEEILEKTGHTVGLDNVTLKINEGETFVCMGLSGSGKSTLISHLNRLIDPTDGEILIEGTNVMSLKKENAVLENRKLMGATDPKNAEDGTLRKKFGISIDKNSVHGSDSLLNAKKEIDFFFKS